MTLYYKDILMIIFGILPLGGGIITYIYPYYLNYLNPGRDGSGDRIRF